MDELPDLARLSVAEKDELIRDVWSLLTDQANAILSRYQVSLDA